MESLFQAEFWARWLGIVIIDLSLAGDNAVVIAMAVLTLPERQRLVGLIGGTAGAVVLRIILIAVMTEVLLIPFLQAVGAAVLLWIAVKLVRQDAGAEAERKVRKVATAHGDITLVLFGIGLSIPIVICGSSLLAGLMERFPWIVWLGGGVLGWVAGELAVTDALVRGLIGSWEKTFDWILPALLAGTVTVLGKINAKAAGK
jgi:predicted tellurium resistance membrane protein TerC